jgi:hypothetical protein
VHACASACYGCMRIRTMRMHALEHAGASAHCRCMHAHVYICDHTLHMYANIDHLQAYATARTCLYMHIHMQACTSRWQASYVCMHILILQHTLVQLLRHAMCANCLACSLFDLHHVICNVHNEVHAAHAVHDMQLVRHVACASHGMCSSFSMHLMQCVPHATHSMRIAQLGQHTACSMQCMHAQRMHAQSRLQSAARATCGVYRAASNMYQAACRVCSMACNMQRSTMRIMQHTS